MTVDNAQLICTCDGFVEEIFPGLPGNIPDPIDCSIPPRIVFYLMWIEDDLGLDHLHQIPNRNTHIMNKVYGQFLTELWNKTRDKKYDIEIRNIRKGHTPHNAYVVWKRFKLDASSPQQLNDHQSRAGAPYFFEAFDVLQKDLSTIKDEIEPLVFTVTIQGRLKVRVKVVVDSSL